MTEVRLNKTAVLRSTANRNKMSSEGATLQTRLSTNVQVKKNSSRSSKDEDGQYLISPQRTEMEEETVIYPLEHAITRFGNVVDMENYFSAYLIRHKAPLIS